MNNLKYLLQSLKTILERYDGRRNVQNDNIRDLSFAVFHVSYAHYIKSKASGHAIILQQRDI